MMTRNTGSNCLSCEKSRTDDRLTFNDLEDLLFHQYVMYRTWKFCDLEDLLFHQHVMYRTCRFCDLEDLLFHQYVMYRTCKFCDLEDLLFHQYVMYRTWKFCDLEDLLFHQYVIYRTWKVCVPNAFRDIRIVGSGVHTGSTRHVDHFWPIVPVRGDCEDGELGGMKPETNLLSYDTACIS
jgi:hypothetical protein